MRWTKRSIAITKMTLMSAAIMGMERGMNAAITMKRAMSAIMENTKKAATTKKVDVAIIMIIDRGKVDGFSTSCCFPFS